MMEQKSSLDQTSSESFFFFNPRTPCGVRQTGGEITWTRCWFQSTHSLRSATGDCASYSSVSSSFNPRTPCGVRLNIESSSDEEEEEVSIHALLAECDQWLLSRGYTPTVSIHALLAECDSPFPTCRHSPPVSIHALLAECDHQPGWGNDDGTCFNPRTPCGVRLSVLIGDASHSVVSIHALLAECDFLTRVAISPLRSFNPRTPCGVRLGNSFRKQHKGKFQSTHSLRSATVSDYALIHYIPVSIHALLAECDLSSN